jgi:beta-galactosidase/beta-glucuronidase
MRSIFHFTLLAILTTAEPVFAGAEQENPWASYRFAPDALQEIDLTSDAPWTLSADDGLERPILVTGGGWNSDRQNPPIPSAAVKDHVLYKRKIHIPAAAKDRVVKLLFGGCNYGAEVYLDDRKVAEHHGPMTPFEADLTGFAKPEETHRLRMARARDVQRRALELQQR